MFIEKSVYLKMLRMSVVPYETGAVLGGKDKIITEIEFDKGLATNNEECYYPDVSKLNNIIDNWYKNNISFYGIAHTHKSGAVELSYADIRYIKKISNKNKHSILYFPIVIPNEQIVWYKVFDEKILKTCIKIL